MSQSLFLGYGVATGLGFLDDRAVEEESEERKGGISSSQNGSVQLTFSDDQRQGEGSHTPPFRFHPCRSEPALPSLAGRIAMGLGTGALG